MKYRISYRGKEVYLGIDVHRHKYVVSGVVLGEQVDKFVYTGSCEDFVAMLSSRYAGSKKVKSCYEAGFSGYGLHRQLLAEGFENIVVIPKSPFVYTWRLKKFRYNDRNVEQSNILSVSRQIFDLTLFFHGITICYPAGGI